MLDGATVRVRVGSVGGRAVLVGVRITFVGVIGAGGLGSLSANIPAMAIASAISKLVMLFLFIAILCLVNR